MSIETLRSRLQYLQLSLETKRSEYDETKNKYREINSARIEANKEIDKYTGVYDRVVVQFDHILCLLTDRQNSVHAEDKDINKTTRETVEMENDSDSIVKEIEVLLADTDKAEAITIEHQETYKPLKEELCKAETDYAAAVAREQSLSSMLKLLEKDEVHYSQRLKELQTIKEKTTAIDNSMKLKIDSLKKELSQAELQSTAAEEESEMLQSTLVEIEDEASEWHDQMIKLREELGKISGEEPVHEQMTPGGGGTAVLELSAA